MKKIGILCLGLFTFFSAAAQRTFTISGKIREAGTGEALIGASVYVSALKRGAVSNQYGFFSLALPPGQHEVVASFVGFGAEKLSLTLQKDTTLALELRPTTLQEVIVRDNAPMRRDVGFLNIPVQRLKQIPMLLGGPDLLKALAMTPGVVVGQEGSSGLYVRGSSPEQNLILLDEAPVYNPSHVFGFLSTFNPDAIKNVDLYKGGFPARYGGRAAAVLDLTMKEGNNQKASQELSIGVLASRFLAEGPIGKGRTSYLIAARQMNTGLIFLPQNIKLWTGGTVSNLTNLWFYDLNAKINHTFSDKSQLLFSAYHNNDFFKTAEQNPSNKSITSLNWGNLTSTLRYNRALAPRLFGKVTLGYSRFKYRMSSETSTKITDDVITNSFTVRNTIQDWFVKAGLEYTPSPSYTLRVGGEQFWHRYYPGRVTVVESSHPEFDQPNASTPIYTQESAAYLENDFQAGSAFRLNLGLRMAKLAVNGKTYPSMEPRLSMALALSPRHTLKLGVSRMRQFMHQLTSNGVGIPNDIWVPATERVPPVLAQQLDAGLYWQLGGKGDWHLSLEGYRKQLLGLIDYPQGTDLVSDFKKNWQDLVITNVAGRVYGLEGMVQKKVGNLNGWLSYTYSVSRRQSFGINQGKWYPARYDRPHSLAAVLNYKITPNWSVSTNFIYQSGFPVTLPVATVVGFNGEPTPVYTDRNNGRMPNYHRLDVGATYRFTTRRNREASWNFGVYNLYGRNNPYYLEPEAIKRQVDTPAGKPLVWQYDRIQINKRAGLPILPYVSYQIKF